MSLSVHSPLSFLLGMLVGFILLHLMKRSRGKEL